MHYNRVIRKTVTAFGELFSNITLVRYNPDNTEQERFIVPIAHAAKELYVMRLQGDYDLDKKVQITLPRMSFEMNGISYDASRKQNTNIKNFAHTPDGLVSQYNPVPYNFDFSLYLYVRNIEDGNQIIEHILPYFTPDYTLKLNLIPELGIIKEIPVVLKDTQYEITYEGDRDSDTRMIIWTLNFTAKGFIYGDIKTTGVIRHSITNILNMNSDSDTVMFMMDSDGIGSYKSKEIVYQGYNIQQAIATGEVVSWSNNVLELTHINGNFVSDRSIIGKESNAKYTFNTYNVSPQKFVRIDVVPNPIDATANSNYTYDTTITEY